MTKTQEAMLRVQVDNLSLEVERQNEEIKKLATVADLNHTTIMQLQSQNLQLTAIVQRQGSDIVQLECFITSGEEDYDILAKDNKENLRQYIRSTIKSDAFISVGTFTLDGLD
jgi:hypothetical protein